MTQSTEALDSRQTEITPRKKQALVVLCLAQFGIVLAFQGTAISLPDVERALGLSVSRSQWIISINALAYGGLLLPAGRAADLVGHRRMFIAGSALFGIASLMAGLAPAAGWLIAARALQGAGAAMFTPAMIALLADIFPDGPERRRALAFWGAAGPAGGIIAILLGGALASALGWRALFLLGAPVSLLIVLLATALPPAHISPRQDRLNPLGAVSGALGVASLVYGLSLLSNAPFTWSGVIAAFGIGLALIALFVRIERRSHAPLIPTALREERSAWRPVGIAFFHAASTNTPIVFYSLFMQHFRQASPWDIGIGFLPCNIAIIAGSAASARVARKTGYRIVMAAGMAIVIAGLLTLATLSLESRYLAVFLPGWILMGLGLGAAQVGIIGAATERIAPEARGAIGGLVNTASQIGTAVGLALLVTLSNRTAGEIDGYRVAFIGGGVLAAIGLVIALVTPKRGAVSHLRSDERRAPAQADHGS